MKRKKHNFSKKHWIIIIFGFILFFLYNAAASDGMNVIIPQLSAEQGWNYEYLLSFATVAGVISCFFVILFGKLGEKKGPRFMICISLIATGVFFFLYGHAASIPMFVVALCGVISCSSAFSFVGVSSLVANWFPTKKGIAQGFASMGCPFSSMTSVAMFTFAFAGFGFGPSMTFFAVLLGVMAVICLIVLKDTPEECGEYPDSIPPEERSREELETVSIGTPRSTREVMKDKRLWMVAVLMGFYSMCSLGVMGQFVVRHSEISYLQQEVVLLMLTCCAVAGLFGGPIWGALDTRFGTKKAYILCALNYMIALLLNFTDSLPLICISIVMLGLGACGIQVFLTAWLVSIFGRRDFGPAYTIAYPITNVFCQTCYLVIAIARSTFGEMRYAYLFFAAFLFISIVISLFVRVRRVPADAPAEPSAENRQA